MRFFEDLQVGEKLTSNGLVVDAAEAAEFARRYDPEHVPQPNIYYSDGDGPHISRWLVAALSWKMLADCAATDAVHEAAFSRPSDLQWKHPVSPRNALRLEAEVIELLPPRILMRKHGAVQVKVSLFATGEAGLGTWDQDEGELVENVALTYSSELTARRRDEFTGKLPGF